jgi:hypothetical protein
MANAETREIAKRGSAPKRFIWGTVLLCRDATEARAPRSRNVYGGLIQIRTSLANASIPVEERRQAIIRDTETS